jgi:hypothetical protein
MMFMITRIEEWSVAMPQSRLGGSVEMLKRRAPGAGLCSRSVQPHQKSTAGIRKHGTSARALGLFLPNFMLRQLSGSF